MDDVVNIPSIAGLCGCLGLVFFVGWIWLKCRWDIGYATKLCWDKIHLFIHEVENWRGSSVSMKTKMEHMHCLCRVLTQQSRWKGKLFFFDLVFKSLIQLQSSCWRATCSQLNKLEEHPSTPTTFSFQTHLKSRLLSFTFPTFFFLKWTWVETQTKSIRGLVWLGRNLEAWGGTCTCND